MTVDCKETGPALGPDPNWEQQFIFHLRMNQLMLDPNNNSLNESAATISSFSTAPVSKEVENLQYLSEVLIELVLLKGNFERRDATVGCVRIGQRTCLAGKQHWLEACVCNQDNHVMRWHELRPLDQR